MNTAQETLARPPPRLVSPHRSTSSVSTISSSNEETLSELQQFNIATESIIFGGSNGVATNSVEVLKCIQATDDKKIFDVLWEGRPAIAKCWTQIDDQRYTNERVTYELLEEKHPNSSCSSSSFAKFFSAGTICCSSVFPTGNILVIEKVRGVRLDGVWAMLTEAMKDVIFRWVSEGVKTLRACGAVWVDAGLHNILFDRAGPQLTVTLVDFELLQFFEEEIDITVEQASIFGYDMVHRLTSAT